MRAPGGSGDGTGIDVIAKHPAMRRIMGTQRAWVDAGRLLAYRTALELDAAKHHPDATRRLRASRWASLVTPVLKAAWTDQAFIGASACLQVFGGHGYVREWGVEQIVRDARVAMIYEGTNEIQAIDLLVRKVLPDGGVAIQTLLDELNASCHGDAQVLRLNADVQSITDALVDAAKRSVELPFWVADDYLRLVALALQAWAWAQVESEARQAARWVAPQQAFNTWILPEFDMRMHIVHTRLAGLAMA
jgi:hypothetical protein